MPRPVKKRLPNSPNTTAIPTKQRSGVQSGSSKLFINETNIKIFQFYLSLQGRERPGSITSTPGRASQAHGYCINAWRAQRKDCARKRSLVRRRATMRLLASFSPCSSVSAIRLIQPERHGDSFRKNLPGPASLAHNSMKEKLEDDKDLDRTDLAYDQRKQVELNGV